VLPTRLFAFFLKAPSLQKLKGKCVKGISEFSFGDGHHAFVPFEGCLAESVHSMCGKFAIVPNAHLGCALAFADPFTGWQLICSLNAVELRDLGDLTFVDYVYGRDLTVLRQQDGVVRCREGWRGDIHVDISMWTISKDWLLIGDFAIRGGEWCTAGLIVGPCVGISFISQDQKKIAATNSVFDAPALEWRRNGTEMGGEVNVELKSQWRPSQKNQY